MSRRKKKKRQAGIPNPMAMTNPPKLEERRGTVTPLRQPEIFETDSVKNPPNSIIISRGGPPANASRFHYAQALPHEIQSLTPLIIDFFRDINWQKAVDDPWPLIKQMNLEMVKNPYSIVYVCYDDDKKLHGYIWFQIDRDPWGDNFVFIKHNYIINEHRKTLREARIHREFLIYAIETGERCNVQYAETVVRSKRLEASRMKLGFVPFELGLRFIGTAEDFRVKNPAFRRRKKYEEEEEVVKERLLQNLGEV